MIAFRVDANEKIGIGHLMRCLAIAKELKKQGAEVLFLTSDNYPTQAILENGFKHFVLNTAYNNLEYETEVLLQIIYTMQIECLVVDSYFVTANYFKNIGNIVKTVYIDDLSKEAFFVDILINYNIFSNKSVYKKLYQSQSTRLLLNTKYVPLREEFCNLKPVLIRKKTSDILITTGGSDTFFISSLLAQRLLSDEYFNDKNIHVVAGKYFKNVACLKEMANKFARLNIYENVELMSNLIMKCDVVISASGSTLYELCACSKPSIIFSFADNQTLIRECFGKKRIMIDCGDFRDKGDECINNIVKALKKLEGRKIRTSLCRKASSIIDKKGCIRIAVLILNYLNIKSQEEDCNDY